MYLKFEKFILSKHFYKNQYHGLGHTLDYLLDIVYRFLKDNKITKKDILTLLVGKNTTTCAEAEAHIQDFDNNPGACAEIAGVKQNTIKESAAHLLQTLSIAKSLIHIGFKEDVMQFFQISSESHPERAVYMKKLSLFFNEIYHPTP